MFLFKFDLFFILNIGLRKNDFHVNHLRQVNKYGHIGSTLAHLETRVNRNRNRNHNRNRK